MSSKTNAVPAQALVAQVAVAVAMAQQSGWAVAWYSTLTAVQKALQAQGLPTLPASHPNWAAKSGGKAQGYLLATRKGQAVAWYAFVGHNGHAGRMGWAGTCATGATAWTGANVGQALAHIQAPAPQAPARATKATKASKGQATSAPASTPAKAPATTEAPAQQ